VPKAVADAIYGGVSGASLRDVQGLGTIYVLPCATELNLTFSFGGRPFAVHPLDVVLDAGLSGGDCVGGFQPISTDTGGLFDAIFGMAFLRNAYLLVNFGDFVDGAGATATADPYVQLLSVSNDSAALHREFAKARSDGGGGPTHASWWLAHRGLVIGVAAGVLALLAVAAFTRAFLARRRTPKAQPGAGSYIPLGRPAPPAATDLHYQAPPAYQPYSNNSPYAPLSGPPPSGAYAPPSGPPPSQQPAYADPFRDHP
jgi:hypothetical protein